MYVNSPNFNFAGARFVETKTRENATDRAADLAGYKSAARVQIGRNIYRLFIGGWPVLRKRQNVKGWGKTTHTHSTARLFEKSKIRQKPVYGVNKYPSDMHACKCKLNINILLILYRLPCVCFQQIILF